MNSLRRTSACPDTPRATRRTGLRRAATSRCATALVGGTLVGPPTAAWAHVRVLPDSTEAGGRSALTFRVPNESASATTVAVSVELPSGTPFLSVSTRPVPARALGAAGLALGIVAVVVAVSGRQPAPVGKE